MSYRISRTAVESSIDTLTEIQRNIRRGEPTFFDVPPRVTPQTFIHNMYSLLASAKFHSDLGFGDLKDKCSVTIDYDEGCVVVYPVNMGKWNKPGSNTDRQANAAAMDIGGTLRSVHDAYAEFRNSDKKETQLKFRLPSDWDEEIEGMGGKTGEDLFRLALDSDNITIGELTIHTQDDGTRWASCYAVKDSVTHSRQASGGSAFDVLSNYGSPDDDS